MYVFNVYLALVLKHHVPKLISLLSILTIKNVTYNLRNDTGLQQPGYNTVTYGLNLFSYKETKGWNDVPNDVTYAITLDEFNMLITNMEWLKMVLFDCTMLH